MWPWKVLEKEEKKPSSQRDEVFENTLLKHRYFLLYLEISYAMNKGDVAQLENLFLPWITIFKSTGKNKYATQMITFILDLHYMFPEPLWYVLLFF